MSKNQLIKQSTDYTARGYLPGNAAESADIAQAQEKRLAAHTDVIGAGKTTAGVGMGSSYREEFQRGDLLALVAAKLFHMKWCLEQE